jgi:hypothetical protein
MNRFTSLDDWLLAIKEEHSRVGIRGKELQFR